MKFCKSNSGLGHLEYVLLMHVEGRQYIILNDIDFYKKGDIELFSNWELEPVSEEEIKELIS